MGDGRRWTLLDTVLFRGLSKRVGHYYIIILFALGRILDMYSLPILSLISSALGLASTQSDHYYSVYRPPNQVVFGGNRGSAASPPGASYTGLAAYDPTVLQAPAPPNPPVPTNQFVQLFSGGMNGLSKQQTGAFFGFSVEMSVATHICWCPSPLVPIRLPTCLFFQWERIAPSYKCPSST